MDETVKLWISVLSPVVQFAIGLIGAAIALQVYRLSENQRQDTWLRTLWDFQRSFWQENDFQDVRAWIACDPAYEQVRPILAKRKAIYVGEAPSGEAISREEYRVLEKIDKFAALVAAYKRIAPTYTKHGQTLHRLFDDYWIRALGRQDRGDLRWYVGQFFPELLLPSPGSTAGLAAERNQAMHASGDGGRIRSG